MLSKHLQKQDWESVYIKRHICIDPMTYWFHTKLSPSHFTTKLRPWRLEQCSQKRPRKEKQRRTLRKNSQKLAAPKKLS